MRISPRKSSRNRRLVSLVRAMQIALRADSRICRLSRRATTHLMRNSGLASVSRIFLFCASHDVLFFVLFNWKRVNQNIIVKSSNFFLHSLDQFIMGNRLTESDNPMVLPSGIVPQSFAGTPERSHFPHCQVNLFVM